MVRLILADIEDLAASGAYGGLRVISPKTSATVLSSAVWLRQLFNWIGAGYDLTEDEMDTIDELVSQLENDLMVGIPGQIITNMSKVNTPGTLYCNGQRYNRVDYPELYAVLPDALIVSVDVFEVPQMNSRFWRGDTVPNPQGSIGGQNSVELLEKHLPAITAVNPGGQPNVEIGTGFGLEFPVDGGTPHENQPNYMNVRFEIVTGRVG